MNRLQQLILLILLTPFAAYGLPFGNTQTDNLLVTANMTSICSITANPLAFGNYTGTSPITQSTTIDVNCVHGTAYSVTADLGVHSPGSTQRAMNCPTATANLALEYNIYTDGGRTNIWGDTAIVGTVPLPNTGVYTGNATAQQHTIYGSIPAGQATSPGAACTDTVVVTVNF